MSLRRFLPRLERITESAGPRAGMPYMTRLLWGRARLHVFHRGDLDPDLHCHPWSFWTFPLVSYLEEVKHETFAVPILRRVDAFRLHYRPADFAHRVIGPCAGTKIVTIVWRSPKVRDWGFHLARSGTWHWVPWRAYVFRSET